MDHSFLLYLNKILLLSLTMKRIERKTFMLKDFVSLVKSANNPRKKNCSGCAMGSTRICILFWTSVLKNKYSLFLHVAISAMNLVIRFYSRRKTLWNAKNVLKITISSSLLSHLTKYLSTKKIFLKKKSSKYSKKQVKTKYHQAKTRRKNRINQKIKNRKDQNRRKNRRLKIKNKYNCRNKRRNKKIKNN